MLNHSEDPKIHERFFAMVDVAGDCWLWTGALDHNGSGMFSVGGQFDASGKRRNSMMLAHRFAWVVQNGPIPAGSGHHGTCVLHSCLNLNCVNQKHLYLGTAQDAVRAMDERGRRVNAPKLGEAHANAKLTEKDVRQIVARFREGGITQRQLASIYGVSKATVNHIFTGRLWSHLGLATKREF
jgi:DNA-binding XRE family transcriptional regulator